MSLQANMLVQSDVATNFDLIIQRIQSQHSVKNIQCIDKEKTEKYLSHIQANGSFDDIDYASRSQTLWEPIHHLERMKSIVLSYTTQGSVYFQDDAIYNHIVKLFEYWYTAHPTSTNWWFQKISAPQQMGVLLILMRKAKQQLPSNLEEVLLERMRTEGDRPDLKGSQGTGANKLDIATHWIYRGLLTHNEEVFRFGVEQVYYPLFITKSEGLQEDFSYHQHGSQIHIGGYGTVFIKGIASIAAYMVDTPYALPENQLSLLSHFVRKAYIPMVRGQHFMYNVVGRSISRENALNQKDFASVLSLMKQIDPQFSNEYSIAIERLLGNEYASYKVNAANTWYHRSDYTLHQRPHYAFDVRGSTINTARNENGNKENLKGYFLCDGAYSLVKDGNEYENIFAVWDWSRVPGTTTPVMSEIPLPSAWENPGTSLFYQTASDGVYGVTSYLYNDSAYQINTEAKKAWFMFDDQIVALGAGIHSTSNFAINTTLEQNLLKESVLVKQNKRVSTISSADNLSLTGIHWVSHNNTVYYFPEKTNVKLNCSTVEGSWHQINNAAADKLYSKDVFKLWIDHGVHPTDAGYSYIILPHVDNPTDINNLVKDIKIIRNDSVVQAVVNTKLDMLGVVAYSPVHFIYENIDINITEPRVILLKNISKKGKVEVVYAKTNI